MRQSRRRRILRAVSAAVMCWLFFSLAATPMVLRIAFPRYTAEGADESVPPESRPVFIASDSGGLRGWVLDAEQPKGVVLVLHGMRGSAEEMLRDLNIGETGWTTVAVNMTGVNGSDGAWTVGIQQALTDGRKAVEWIKEQPGWSDLPLAVLGYSAGAWAAAMLSGEDAVDGVICISGFDRPVTFMVDCAERAVGPLVLPEEPFLRLCEAFLFGSEADASGAKALKDSGKPALIVHGSEDRTVPIGQSIYAGCGPEDTGLTELTAEHAGHALKEVVNALPDEAFPELLEKCSAPAGRSE